MLFLLGTIFGFIVALLVVVMTIYFKVKLIKLATYTETRVNRIAGEKGFVVNPLTEAQEAREGIMLENDKNNRDTYLSDLL